MKDIDYIDDMNDGDSDWVLNILYIKYNMIWTLWTIIKPEKAVLYDLIIK